jgi:hypothetical protein
VDQCTNLIISPIIVNFGFRQYFFKLLDPDPGTEVNADPTCNIGFKSQIEKMAHPLQKNPLNIKKKDSNLQVHISSAIAKRNLK